jgi:hypothetical protein
MCEVGKEILFGYRFLQAGGVHPDHKIVSGDNSAAILSYYFPQNPFYSISSGRHTTFF